MNFRVPLLYGDKFPHVPLCSGDMDPRVSKCSSEMDLRVRLRFGDMEFVFLLLRRQVPSCSLCLDDQCLRVPSV